MTKSLSPHTNPDLIGTNTIAREKKRKVWCIKCDFKLEIPFFYDPTFIAEMRRMIKCPKCGSKYLEKDL